MPAVKILDDVVVNQIAAGEVVERPASVVKELVENAIDAGATEVRVSIANGGKTAIEVQDDGCGMSKEDALVAVQRFGTSKIRSADDLERISTLGFRGEAIPSIASVSRFKLTSAARDGSPGVQITIEGGIQQSVDELACPSGTTIEVRSLFFNVPARKKFLRTESTEAAQVRSLMSDFALAYPALRFTLTVDSAPVPTYPQVADFGARVQQIKLAGTQPLNLHEQFITGDREVLVRGVICSPIESASNASKLRLLVNGRSVRDKLLLRAVRDGYGTFLRPGRHPAGVVALELPPDEVDVNVHPQKSEVRFRNSSEVFRAVMLSVSRALSRAGAELQAAGAADPRDAAIGGNPETMRPLWRGFERDTPVSIAQPVVFFGSGSNLAPCLHTTEPLVAAGDPAEYVRAVSSVASTTSDSPVGDLLEMRFVGQILSLYLLFEGYKNGRGVFAILDMHAAHERVTFFKLKQSVNSGTVESQQLLLPITVELAAEEVPRFREGSTAFERLGFSFDVDDDGLLSVTAVPAILAHTPIGEILRDIVAESETAGWEKQLEAFIDQVIARIACHGSVRSGRILKEEEVRALLCSMLEADTSGLCPHGRPVVRFFSSYELEQLFGRVQ